MIILCNSENYKKKRSFSLKSLMFALGLSVLIMGCNSDNDVEKTVEEKPYLENKNVKEITLVDVAGRPLPNAQVSITKKI